MGKIDNAIRSGSPAVSRQRGTGRKGIPTEATLRVCSWIEPDRSLPALRIEQSLDERWEVLTSPLRLAGALAMQLSASGNFAALQHLADGMPWAATVIVSLERQLRTQLALGRPWVRFEPMLLLGAPGVGKSWLARKLAEALDVPSAVLELGSASDDRTLSGTARGWSNTQPAWPLIVMARSQVANPMLVVDELDKAGGSERGGRPHHALLAMVEPSSSRAWYDQCLLTPCDLSEVTWIGCANDLGLIPAVLRSRFHIVRISPPAPEHFEAAIASVVMDVAKGWAVPRAMLPELPQRALTALRNGFTQTRSIRQLARDTRAILGALLADGGGPRRH